MWFFRWILVAVIILLVLGFSLQNANTVDLRFFKYKWDQVPFYVVIYFSFAAGLLVFLLVAIYQQLVHKVQLHKCRSEVKKLNKKLEEISADYEERILELEAKSDEDSSENELPDSDQDQKLLS